MLRYILPLIILASPALAQKSVPVDPNLEKMESRLSQAVTQEQTALMSVRTLQQQVADLTTQRDALRAKLNEPKICTPAPMTADGK